MLSQGLVPAGRKMASGHQLLALLAQAVNHLSSFVCLSWMCTVSSREEEVYGVHVWQLWAPPTASWHLKCLHFDSSCMLLAEGASISRGKVMNIVQWNALILLWCSLPVYFLFCPSIQAQDWSKLTVISHRIYLCPPLLDAHRHPFAGTFSGLGQAGTVDNWQSSRVPLHRRLDA